MTPHEWAIVCRQADRDAQIAHRVGEALQRARDWTGVDPQTVAAEVYDAIENAIRAAVAPRRAWPE